MQATKAEATLQGGPFDGARVAPEPSTGFFAIRHPIIGVDRSIITRVYLYVRTTEGDWPLVWSGRVA